MTTLPANRTELSPLRFLERSATVFPDKVAVVYGDRTSTYAELAEEVQALAARLRQRIEPGDRVATLAPNVPEVLVAHFAVPLAGGVLVTINSRLARPEVEYILGHSGARILLADTELLVPLAGLRDAVPGLDLVVEVRDPTVTDRPDQVDADLTYADLMAEPADQGVAPLPWTVEDEDTTISINYTSGTTGNPKGVMYTHRGAYLAATANILHNGLDGDTRFLWTLPMFHCNGWCGPWAVTGAAGTHLCLRAVRGEAVWHAIDELGATHLWGAPTVLTTIAEAPQAHPVTSPLQITTAGAPPSPAIISRMQALGIDVLHVYGLTESYGPFTITETQPSWAGMDAAERAQMLARQGVGMLLAETVRVVDEAMQDVAADGETFGEIVLRGNIVMAGYFEDPAATARAFDGGWFHTGDIGVMHPDGYIEIKDRSKDVIISGGENISSVEVEKAILAHPDVMEAAVVGVADEKWGERPRAFVTVRAGAAVSGDDLVAHTRGLLAGYKVPREFVVLDELPHTATGKIVKYELRGRA